MPSAREQYNANILLARYDTVDMTRIDRHLNPCLRVLAWHHIDGTRKIPPQEENT